MRGALFHALFLGMFAAMLLPVASRAQVQPSQQAPDNPQPSGLPAPGQKLPPLGHTASAPGVDSASGFWKAESVPFSPWRMRLTVVGTAVTGTISQSATDQPDGPKTDLTGPFDIYDGTAQGGTIAFKCKTPDGNRTVSFVGNLAGDEIIFTRTVTTSDGVEGSAPGVFDSSGTRAFIVRRDSEPSPSHAPEQPAADKPSSPPPPKTANRGADASAGKSGTDKPASGKSESDKSASDKAGGNPNYDPFHAAQDIDVGMFYMHKGDYDAAIDRFKDAIRLKPNFAKPRLLLGELYEKRGDKADAIRYYKEFLEILPDGPESKKVRARLEKLGAK